MEDYLECLHHTKEVCHPRSRAAANYSTDSPGSSNTTRGCSKNNTPPAHRLTTLRTHTPYYYY
ncbi:hypothetical protein PORY_000055 [Pneumocystis oryctolagi]|uniref:Uncharacterized protein n=1 Tax=Pneumocystis oryctolagi TaxID=42067 RepID=A0ACB7CG26_9ASCO|nr:hypothetical protein PORY_000055 [Pneumocystis oryctolagi]